MLHFIQTNGFELIGYLCIAQPGVVTFHDMEKIVAVVAAHELEFLNSAFVDPISIDRKMKPVPYIIFYSGEHAIIFLFFSYL